MKTQTVEVSRRDEKGPRPNWLCLLVDGDDAEISLDPAQWMPEEILAAKGDAVKAMEACIARGEAALQMRIARLQAGRALGHGVDGDSRHATPGSIEAYMQRGALAGLDKAQRKARATRRANRFDNDRDWADRRAKLVEECKKELAAAEAKEPGPKRDRAVAYLKDRLAGLTPKVVALIHGFQFAYTQYWTGAVNLSTNDIRIWPYMTNTTLDSLRDAVDTFSDVALDEFDGAGYTTGGLVLASKTVLVDDANDRAEFDCADVTVVGLGAGTRQMQGVGVGKFVTSTALSMPLHSIDFTSNKSPDGSDFVFVINAEGLLQMSDG